MSAGRIRSRALALIIGGALAFVAWLSPRVLPFSMDEFVHYHALGCAETRQEPALPPALDFCAEQQLRLPFTRRFLPLRSYTYIGSLPAVLFYPFWRVLERPAAARVQGAVFFLAVVLLSARHTRASLSATALAAALLPTFLFSMVYDLGPVGLTLVLLLLALHAACRVCDPAGTPLARGLAWGALGGFAVALAFWTKLVVVWTFPALVLIVGARLAEARLPLGRLLKRYGPAVTALLATSAVPAVTLLMTSDREGQRYFSLAGLTGATTDWRAFRTPIRRLLSHLLDGGALIPRSLELSQSLWDFGPALLGVVVIGCGLALRPRRPLLIYLGAAALTLANTVFSWHSWGPHHVAYTVLFVVMGLAITIDALRRRWPAAFAILTLACAAVWGSILLRLPPVIIDPELGFAKDELLTEIREQRLDRGTIQVHASWGTYYISHLFGDRARIVLTVDDLERSRERRGQILALARAGRRRILLVTMSDDVRGAEAVRADFGQPIHTRRIGPWSAQLFDPR
jgi:hypothetical protein